MTLLYTINGISGTPRQAIIDYLAAYLGETGQAVTLITDPKGSSHGKLANDIVVHHHIAPSAFTEALLYLTCSKEVLDQIDWHKDGIVVSKGSFLEVFGYQNQLADWALEDARQLFYLFAKQISHTYPFFSIVLTEDYLTTEKRAGKKFEYKDQQAKYVNDSCRFLNIKAHPIVQEIGIKVVNVEVKSRDPWKVFQEEIVPRLPTMP